jgi:hypothetical protein
MVKYGAAIAAVLIIAVIGWNLLPGRSSGVGGQPTASPSPTATPSANPTTSPAASGPTALSEGQLKAGRYRIQPFGDHPSLSLTADIPAGWLGVPDIPAVTGPTTEEPPDGMLIGFQLADGLFSDPCHWDLDGTGSADQPGDVSVGTTVDTLVAALKANKSYTSSAATPITLGGFEGKALELQLPGDDVLSTCDGQPGEHRYFVFEKGFYSQGPNSRWHLFIVDVEGTLMITFISYFPGTPPALVAAGEAIVNSFEITP